MQITGKQITWLVVMVMLLAAMGCSAVIETSGIGNQSASGEPALDVWPSPLKPKPAEGLLKPGLAVWYYKKKIRHIGSMPDSDKMTENGYQGKPIPRLAHRFGAGEVFDSGVSQGICVEIRGAIELSKIGDYRLKANSNDGIRIFLDGKMVLDDPDVHGDRFTPQAIIPIDEPGWYELLVKYFQRKGTATLELYWQEPGKGTFEMVPEAAYGH
jgi:hypothetical protein